jgi:YfiH family protein
MNDHPCEPHAIFPDWPAPAGVHALTTLRSGGVSQGPYADWNLADHVGDAPEAVRENRRRLRERFRLPAEPAWLGQVHGGTVVNAARIRAPEADGSYATQAGVVCAVLTADCLPVLLCSQDGQRVAAVHAGWRGLAGGVLEAALEALGPGDHLAWLGPAIGPVAFEVGPEVRNAFLSFQPAAAAAFQETRPGHWLADLYGLARLRLAARGVDAVYGGEHCTFREAERFYSYRRDGVTGRMASLIWRE